MTGNSRRVMGALVALAALACTEGDALDRADTSSAHRLAGEWDIVLVLERSPVLTNKGAVGDRVRGRLALLENGSLATSYSHIHTPASYGTFAIDFSPFGFQLPIAGATPAAVAGRSSSDSVEIVLEPGQTRVSLRMRGRFVGDSIIGVWDVSMSRAGAGGGRFFMSPHR